MATSNPASIPRFAEIGRQQILRDVHRERSAREAAVGHARAVALRETGPQDLQVVEVRVSALMRLRTVVLGLLG